MADDAPDLDAELAVLNDIEREAARDAASNAHAGNAMAGKAATTAFGGKRKAPDAAAAKPTAGAPAAAAAGAGAGAGAGESVGVVNDALSRALAPYAMSTADRDALAAEEAAEAAERAAAAAAKRPRRTAATTGAAAGAAAAAAAAPVGTVGDADDAEDRSGGACVECRSVSYSRDFARAFGVAVCFACRRKRAPLYTLLTKGEAKAAFLLSDAELAPLPCLVRDNTKPPPHIAAKQAAAVAAGRGTGAGAGAGARAGGSSLAPKKWGVTKLYRLSAVQTLSFAKFGGDQQLKAEIERRELARLERRVSAARKKRKSDAAAAAAEAVRAFSAGGAAAADADGDGDGDGDQVVKAERRVPSYVASAGAAAHTHTFSAATAAAGKPGVSQRTCTTCGFVDEYEEL